MSLLISSVALALVCLNSLLIWLLGRNMRKSQDKLGTMYSTIQRLEREIAQQRYALATLRQLQKGEVPDAEEIAEEEIPEAVEPEETPQEIETPKPADPAPRVPVTETSLKGMSDADILQFVKTAAKNKKLALHQQPIVSLPGRETKYYEVFARIKVGNSYVPASHFVSVAKNNNIMGAIDDLLLMQCLQLLKTQQPNAELFVNVSAQTFANKKYMQDLIEFLSANPKLSSRLIFELPQHESIKLTSDIRDVMEGLALLGCRFSMDQVKIFGMDMNRLLDQHISFVKLDAKALEKELSETSSRKRMKKIKTTLDSQGVTVILEKVENEKQLFDIIDLHADYGQGYLFGAPAPVV